DILHLLAELIDRRFQRQAGRGQAGGGRLRADRVGLAHEFLGEKVEPAAGCGVVRHQRPGGRDVAGQPVELLAHVGAHRQHRRFLHDAVDRRGLAQEVGEAPGEAVADRRRLLGSPALGLAAQAIDAVDKTGQHLAQRGALGQPRGLQRIERLRKARRHRGLDRRAYVGRLVLFADLDNAAQGEEAVGARQHCAAGGDQLVGELDVALQELAVDLGGAGRGRAARLDADVDLAALEPRLRRLAGEPLQTVEAGWAAEAHLEIAAVHRARLDRPAPGPRRALGAAEAGHARELQHLAGFPTAFVWAAFVWAAFVW